jgi:hypothetical protein
LTKKKEGVHTRYLILLIIFFIVTAVNYADRATLSIAGTEVAKSLQLKCGFDGITSSPLWLGLLADANPRRLAA